jgi:hypothetical protein
MTSQTADGKSTMSAYRLHAVWPLAAALAFATLFDIPAQAASPIDPPSGVPVLTLTAVGYQGYACEYDENHRLYWAPTGAHAKLYDAMGRALVVHSEGPTWQAIDGSRITGRIIGQIPSDAPSSVPQLLLASTSVAGPGVLANVRFVQRVGTIGGMRPAAGCTTEYQAEQSAYMAQYVFLE